VPNRKQNMTDEPITELQIKEAIISSGYLVEQRAGVRLREANYEVITNRRYVDSETNKALEYDIYAYKDISVCKSELYSIFPTLICECKHVAQPLVFFIDETSPFEPLVDEVMVSGIPAKIWKTNKYVSVQQYLNVDSFHHYCRPKGKIATQYCTFILNKDGKWIANQIKNLYDTGNKHIKALEYEIEEDFRNMGQWVSDEDITGEFMDLSFYYPLMIVDADMYTYSQYSDEPLKKCVHVQYNPEYISLNSNSVISYHLDIISEKHIPEYLQIIDREMLTIKETLNQRKVEILPSVSKILQECRGLRQKPRTYRKYLEFDYGA